VGESRAERGHGARRIRDDWGGLKLGLARRDDCV
jgi:hypothetical protein